MTQFLAMGGYGAYIWGAYVVALVVLGGLLWQSRRSARLRQAELMALRGTLRPRAIGPTTGPVVERLRPAVTAATPVAE